MFAAADTDKSGVLEYREWCTATINKREVLNNKNLRTAFELFDKDKSGSITASEVKAILGQESSSDHVWTDIIKEVDGNGDGQIEFEEFREMM